MANQSYKDFLLTANPTSTNNDINFEYSKELKQDTQTPLYAVKNPDIEIYAESNTIPHFSCTKIHSVPQPGTIWYDPDTNDLSYYAVVFTQASFGKHIILRLDKYDKFDTKIYTNIPAYYNDDTHIIKLLPNWTYSNWQFAAINGNNQLYIHAGDSKIEVRNLTTLQVFSTINAPSGNTFVGQYQSYLWASQSNIGFIVLILRGPNLKAYYIIKISTNQIVEYETIADGAWVNLQTTYNIIFLSNAIIIQKPIVIGDGRRMCELRILSCFDETIYGSFYLNVLDTRYLGFGRHSCLIKIGTDLYIVSKTKCDEGLAKNGNNNVHGSYQAILSIFDESYAFIKANDQRLAIIKLIPYEKALTDGFGTTIGGAVTKLYSVIQYIDGSGAGVISDNFFAYGLLPYSSTNGYGNRLIGSDGYIFDILDNNGVISITNVKILNGFLNGIYCPISLMPSKYFSKVLFFNEKYSNRIYQLVMSSDTLVSDSKLISFDTFDWRLSDMAQNFIYNANWDNNIMYMNKYEYTPNVLTSGYVKPWAGISDGYLIQTIYPNTDITLSLNLFFKNGKDPFNISLKTDSNGILDMSSKVYIKIYTPNIQNVNADIKNYIKYKFALPTLSGWYTIFTDIQISKTSKHQQKLLLIEPGTLQIHTDPGIPVVEEEVILEGYLKDSPLVKLFFTIGNTKKPLDGNVTLKGISVINKSRSIKDLI